jgi:opacity protein-like surface antigen
MDKLSKFGLMPQILATVTLFLTIQANAVTNSSTDNQILMLGNQRVSIDQVPKPPEIIGKSVFDGFYLGIGPNLTALTGEAIENTDNSPLYNDIGPGRAKYPLSDYNLGVTGFGGIGKVFNQNIYLGGELFANYSPLKTKGYNSQVYRSDGSYLHGFAAEVKSYYTLGGGLRIGYLLSQKAMVYALVGGDFTQFKVISNDADKGSSIQGKSPQLTKDLIGFIPGIGMEAMLNKNWALRAQYTYPLYDKFTDSFIGNHSAPPYSIINAKTKYDLARSSFNLAAVYHFDVADMQNPTLPLYDRSEISLLNGWYMGIGPELTALTGQVKVKRLDMRYNSTEENSPCISSYYPGIQIFGGYGNNYRQWYVGSELFADYSPVKSEHTNDGGNVIYQTLWKLRSDFSYGAALRGGYMLSPRLMIYALLGADLTQFRINSYKGDYYHIAKFDASPQKTKDIIGFMPGIGIESMLYKNLSVRMQYTYTLYRSITDSYLIYENGSTYMNPFEDKYKPAISAFSLLLSYHFMQ